MDTLKNQIIAARAALLVLVGFTVVNLLLGAFDAGFYLLFSAIFPGLVFNIVAFQIGAFWLGLIMALLCASVYLICWALAKKWPVFILLAFILFLLDTVVLFYFAFTSGEILTYVIDVAIAVAILYGLGVGVVAWIKVKRFPVDEYNVVNEYTPEQEMPEQEQLSREEEL